MTTAEKKKQKKAEQGDGDGDQEEDRNAAEEMARNPLGDDRFLSMFSREEFQVDTTSQEFKVWLAQELPSHTHLPCPLFPFTIS